MRYGNIVSAALLGASVFGFCGCTAQKEVVTYQQTQQRDRVSLAFGVGKKANFAFDVSTDDPVVLRMFLMQGFDLRFHGVYDYTVKVPSAKDVENMITHHPGEVKATMQGDSEKRPDIRPVIEALNKAEVFIYNDGRKAGEVKSFHVAIDPQNGVLNYSIVIPNIYSMDLPIGVELTSRRVSGENEFDNGQFPNRNTSGRPQPFGVGDSDRGHTPGQDLTLTFRFDKPAR